MLAITACKIDFNGDLYTSDLIKVSKEDSNISLPMEIKFQVTSCGEDLNELNQTLSGYFSNYKFLNCKTSDDFLDYVTSRVQVPVTNKQESFNKSNESLVGYLTKTSKDKSKIYVYLILNKGLFNNLSSYIESKTFQDLSLKESKLNINLNNDIDDLTVVVYPSYVDSKPVVWTTDYNLKKREKISIMSSNVNASHLQLNTWTPIFYIKM
tara:strand:+ start:214 stop:843 length:630 start_codon:yes stop_codon:yes gene_type:complete